MSYHSSRKEKGIKPNIKKQGKVIYELNEVDKTATVIGLDFFQPLKNIFIPRLIIHETQEFVVTIIRNKAFSCSEIKSIQFAQDSEVQIFEEEAFNLSNIETISIPPHVTQIGSFCFFFCRYLRYIEISPNSELTKINNGIIGPLIENFTIPPNVSELDDGWCAYTPKLNKVKVSEKNKYFKNYGEDVVIGKSNKESEDYDVLVFVNRDVKSFTIPSFIKVIGPSSFSYSKIETIFIPSNITRIKEGAFSNCEQLHHIEFSPDSKISEIENDVFAGSSIENFFIPPKITTIGEYAFSKCQNLSCIEIPIDSKLEVIKSFAFDSTIIKCFMLPSNITELEQKWCISTPELNKVKVSEKNKYFKNYGEDVVIGKSNKESEDYDVLVFVNRDVKSFTIPSFIKVIGPSSFSYSKIETIFIPSNITRIKEGAFSNCEQLHHIEFSPDSKISEIENFVFAGSSIEMFHAPSHITRIGFKSFSECKKLINIEITNDSELQIIEGGAFCSSSIERIFIPSKVIKICTYAFSNCSRLQIVEFQCDSKLQEIGKRAFSNTKIERILIPSNVIQICDSAFLDCTNLINVEFQNDSKLQIIGKRAFSNTKIESFFIPSLVTQIDEYAFSNCLKLRELKISQSSQYREIENNAFYLCPIKSIIIPSDIYRFDTKWPILKFNLNKITVIQKQIQNIVNYDDKIILRKSNPGINECDILIFAFPNINNVVIPPNVTQIGECVFYNCSKLKIVEIDENSLIETINVKDFNNSVSIMIPAHLKIKFK